VDDRTDTTAWFVAYAPARRPRVAVAVMLVGEGAGGESAAPAAREVLLAALKR
jgi:cell division protein FtsI/penicillin-binding protein 2